MPVDGKADQADVESADTTTAGPRGPGAEAAEAVRAAAVRRFLFGLCGDWHLAEDLAQEALLKAWRSRRTFRGQCAARTWVFAIARNLWRDQLRRRRAAPRMETMDSAERSPGRTDAPDAALRRGELAAAIRRAMAALPPAQREALALRQSRGLTFPQVADTLAVPLATAKSRVRYALLKLADDLKDYRSELIP
jgi:RNA polymerase sigma-70 factor (ECF subfamily)